MCSGSFGLWLLRLHKILSAFLKTRKRSLALYLIMTRCMLAILPSMLLVSCQTVLPTRSPWELPFTQTSLSILLLNRASLNLTLPIQPALNLFLLPKQYTTTKCKVVTCWSFWSSNRFTWCSWGVVSLSWEFIPTTCSILDLTFDVSAIGPAYDPVGHLDPIPNPIQLSTITEESSGKLTSSSRLLHAE